mgnify:FL=1
MTITHTASQNSLNAGIKNVHDHYVVTIYPSFSDGVTITISRVKTSIPMTDCVVLMLPSDVFKNEINQGMAI